MMHRDNGKEPREESVEVIVYSGKPESGSFYDEVPFHGWVSGDPLRARQVDGAVKYENGHIMKTFALSNNPVKVVYVYGAQPEDEPNYEQRDVGVILAVPRGAESTIGEVERIIKSAEMEASKKQEVDATITP